MAVTLTETDLLVDISKDELEGLTNELIESGQQDPVEKEIVEELGIIEMYVNPYLVKEEVLKRIWRLLVIAGLYNRLSKIPKKREAEKVWCLDILKQIRDGKFPNLLYDTSAPEALAAQGAAGAGTDAGFGTLFPHGSASTGGITE